MNGIIRFWRKRRDERGKMDCDNKNELLVNIDKLHTTDLGVVRIKKNLTLDTDDVVAWCRAVIENVNTGITRKGKNWYAENEACIITVNAFSYTIITAHKRRNSRFQ